MDEHDLQMSDEGDAKRLKQAGADEEAIVDSEILASGVTDDHPDLLGDDMDQGTLAAAGEGAKDALSADAKPKKKKQPKNPKDKIEKKDTATSAGKSGDKEKDKEFELPLAAINKILKASLPEGVVCQKDAKSAFSKAAGIFVLYITACANDMAKGHKRQTINAQDIMNALTELGYSSFIPHLEATLEKMKTEAAVRKSQKDTTKKDKPADTVTEEQPAEEAPAETLPSS